MGMTMRGGFHVLSYALRLVVMGQTGARRDEGARAARAAHDMARLVGTGKVVVTAASVKTVLRKILKDTVQYGMFLGSFSGGYVALEEGIALGMGRERTRGWRALVAGFVAGGSLVLAGGEKRHTSLALYMALKGLTFLVRCGNVPLVIDGESSRTKAGTEDPEQAHDDDDAERKRTRRAWVRRLLAPTRFSQGDVLLMCLAMSQLGYSWIVEPSTLPVSMLKFLNKHGGQTSNVMDDIRRMCAIGGTSGASSSFSIVRSPQRRSLRGTRTQGGIPCSVVHPGQTCNEHAFGFFPQAYARAIPVYLPVYIVPALLIHRQKLLSDPEIWPKVVKVRTEPLSPHRSCAPTHSLAHSLTHSLTHPLTHSLTHSLARSFARGRSGARFSCPFFARSPGKVSARPFSGTVGRREPLSRPHAGSPDSHYLRRRRAGGWSCPFTPCRGRSSRLATVSWPGGTSRLPKGDQEYAQSGHTSLGRTWSCSLWPPRPSVTATPTTMGGGGTSLAASI